MFDGGGIIIKRKRGFDRLGLLGLLVMQINQEGGLCLRDVGGDPFSRREFDKVIQGVVGSGTIAVDGFRLVDHDRRKGRSVGKRDLICILRPHELAFRA